MKFLAFCLMWDFFAFINEWFKSYILCAPGEVLRTAFPIAVVNLICCEVQGFMDGMVIKSNCFGGELGASSIVYGQSYMYVEKEKKLYNIM